MEVQILSSAAQQGRVPALPEAIGAGAGLKAHWVDPKLPKLTALGGGSTGYRNPMTWARTSPDKHTD